MNACRQWTSTGIPIRHVGCRDLPLDRCREGEVWTGTPLPPLALVERARAVRRITANIMLHANPGPPAAQVRPTCTPNPPTAEARRFWTMREIRRAIGE